MKDTTDEIEEAEQISLSVSKEIQDLFEESLAAQVCRDKAIESVFRAKRAIYYEKVRRQKSTKAWQLVYELWPETNGAGLTYTHETGKITLKGKRKKGRATT